jgi:hypothetical protein
MAAATQALTRHLADSLAHGRSPGCCEAQHCLRTALALFSPGGAAHGAEGSDEHAPPGGVSAGAARSTAHPTSLEDELRQQLQLHAAALGGWPALQRAFYEDQFGAWASSVLTGVST